MANNFRSLEIWQEAYKLALLIYKITDKFPRNEMFSLCDQIRRSSISIVANIAESSGRYYKKDKIQFLIIARGSIYETQSHLSIALGLNYLDQIQFEDIDKHYEILSKRLNAFIGYVKNQQIN